MSTGAHQATQLALFLSALALKASRHLIDEHVEDHNDTECAPEVGYDERHAEHLVVGPGHVAVLGIEGRLAAVAPAEDGCEEEQDGYEPGEQHHDDDLVGRAPLAILGRYLDRAEAVYGDEEYRVDGREADGIVEREPQVANDLTERPPAEHEIESEEGYAEEADEEVGEGQREQKVVCRIADLTVQKERGHDEKVTADGDQARRDGQRAQDYLGWDRVNLFLGAAVAATAIAHRRGE